VPGVREFLGDLDDRAFASLSVVVVDFPWDHRADLASLLASWGSQVRRLAEESVAGATPRDPRTEHDVVGALHARDRLQQGLNGASDQVRALAAGLVEHFDRVFREATVEDEGGLLEMVTGEPVTGTGWWWRRVPRSGPARDGMDRIAAALAGGPAAG